MPSSNESELLQEYKNRRHLYDGFALCVSDILKKAIAEQDIQLHSVTHRAKEEPSLAKKLQRPGGEYKNLIEVTDLAGIRVITYFDDHVDFIAKIVEAEFETDPDNSVDKRKLLDPDRFGYLSLHYIVELAPNRFSLSEYKRFRGLKAEIQIRSMLQHVWAEVEHDLGYKSSLSVPYMIRRRFSRLAGLLELADTEFVAIRDALHAYEAKVPALIADAPASVPLDMASLTAFKDNNELVRELDQFIASLVDGKVGIHDPRVNEWVLSHLDFLGITTIGQLDLGLREYQEDIKKIARASLEGHESETFNQGTCILYFQYAYILRQRDREFARRWMGKLLSEEIVEKVVQRMFEAGGKAGIVGPPE